MHSTETKPCAMTTSAICASLIGRFHWANHCEILKFTRCYLFTIDRSESEVIIESKNFSDSSWDDERKTMRKVSNKSEDQVANRKNKANQRFLRNYSTQVEKKRFFILTSQSNYLFQMPTRRKHYPVVVKSGRSTTLSVREMICFLFSARKRLVKEQLKQVTKKPTSSSWFSSSFFNNSFLLKK